MNLLLDMGKANQLELEFFINHHYTKLTLRELLQDRPAASHGNNTPDTCMFSSNKSQTLSPNLVTKMALDTQRYQLFKIGPWAEAMRFGSITCNDERLPCETLTAFFAPLIHPTGTTITVIQVQDYEHLAILIMNRMCKSLIIQSHAYRQTSSNWMKRNDSLWGKMRKNDFTGRRKWAFLRSIAPSSGDTRALNNAERALAVHRVLLRS